MLLGARITKLRWHQSSLFAISPRLCVKLNFSSSTEAKVLRYVDEDCDDFLPWLERKAGCEISSVLSVGKSVYGRSLFASKAIQAGDTILKVPYNVQISPDNLLPEIKSLLGDEIGNIAKLAIVILVEQQMDQDSEWAPYISHLPNLGQLHNTIFWSEGELEMIHQSPVYEETFHLKAQILKEFLGIRPVLEQFPEMFGSVSLNDFMHAYALVRSRAWESTKGVSLIPFADFSNHDGVSEAIVLSDEDKQLSEVIADRDYAPGEEVLIRYGKFSNATLLLDFGFTLPSNIHDQGHLQITVPQNDLLREMKLELWQRHRVPSMKDTVVFNACRDSFEIKELRSSRGKGRGLSQSLRAFARVLCCTSAQELSDLAKEAAQSDGRLARRPLRNHKREIQAHQILLSHITQLIAGYNSSYQLLGPDNCPYMHQKYAFRKQMARNLLSGELRVLESASAWLKNYCESSITTYRQEQMY